MSDTPEINLTDAVDDAALELFVAAHSTTNSGSDKDAADRARAMWPQLQAAIKLHYRRLALVAIQAAVPDIARQAWDLAAKAADEAAGKCCGCNLYKDGVLDNPWKSPDDWDEALKKL